MTDEKPTTKPLWLAGAMAAALSAAANTVLYLVEIATGAIPWSMLSPGTSFPLNIQRVILVSAAGAIAGTLAFWVIKHVTRRPVKTFRWLSAIVCLLSFAVPFTIAEATPYQAVAIALMHTVATVSTVWALTVWGEAGAGYVV
jgi:hypothetical protein